MKEDNTQKPERKGLGIRFKMVFTTVALLVVLFILISYLFIINQERALTENMEISGISLTSSIAHNCVNAIISNDYYYLSLMTAEMIKNKNILYMAIIKPNGKIISHSIKSLEGTISNDQSIFNWQVGKTNTLEKISFRNQSAFKITCPIMSRNKLWGFVQTANSLLPLQHSIEKSYYYSVSLAIFFIALGTLFILILSKRITLPLLKLTKGAREIGAGNLSYNFEITRHDELGVLAETFNQMARDLDKSLKKLEQTKRLERELEIAYQIQQSLLPRNFPLANGIEVSAFCKPARVVGGDFYDFLTISDEKLGIVIGDVSGKSIQSALYMAITQSIIRSEAERELSPKKVLIATNRLLSGTLSKNSFVTLFYLVVNRKNGDVTYASAGHNPMLYINTKNEISLLKGRGYPLGLEETIFNDRIEEKKVKLTENDTLLLFTDGIIEAINKDGQEFSLERFIDFIKSMEKTPLEKLNTKILDEIQAFAEGTLQHDDITVVSLRQHLVGLHNHN